MKYTSILIASVLLLQPVTALASFETPAAVFAAVRSDADPRSFTGEMHAHNNNIYASMWLRGSQEGAPYSPSFSFSSDVTLDIVDTVSHMNVRIRGGVIVVQNMLYGMLESIEVKSETPFMFALMQLKIKKWIQFPSSNSGETLEVLEAATEELIDEALNQMFSIRMEKVSNGDRYVLTSNDDGMEGIPLTIEMRFNFKHQDIFESSTTDIAADFNGFVLEGTGEFKKKSGLPKIEQPAESITLDAFLEPFGLSMRSFPDLPDFIPVAIPQTADDFVSDDSDDAVRVHTRPVLFGKRLSRRELSRQQRMERTPKSRSVRIQKRSSLGNSTLALGSLDAPVTVVEFTDLECPFCARHFKETFPSIKAKYIDTGKVRYVVRHYPLSFHKNAMSYAVAVECALEQDPRAAWELHDRLLSTGEEDLSYWTPKNVAFDPVAFVSCLTDPSVKKRIDADVALGTKEDVQGVPDFFLMSGGRTTHIFGAQPFKEFEREIEALLSR